MSIISRVKTWIVGETLTAAALNAEFNNILTDYNGGITNANIASNAAIDKTKLALGNLTNSDISASANIDPSKIAGTAVVLTGTQHVTGQKTLDKPVVQGSVGTRTSTASGVFDMALSGYHYRTLDGTNGTLSASNVSTNQAFAIELIQDGTGSRTVTWFSGILWADGSIPTLTTTAAKRDVFCFKCIGASSYLGFIAGQNI